MSVTRQKDLLCVLKGLEEIVKSIPKVESQQPKSFTLPAVSLPNVDIKIPAGVAAEKTTLLIKNATLFAKVAAQKRRQEASEEGKNDAEGSSWLQRMELLQQETDQLRFKPNLSALDILDLDLTDLEAIKRGTFRRKSKERRKKSQENLKPLSVEKPMSKLSPLSIEKRVPSSRIGRAFSFGTLGIGLGIGVLSEASKRAIGISKPEVGQAVLDGSLILSESNAERIVATLCQVRGAALKIGQLLSIQDENLISPQLHKIFERVRQSADYMPQWQLEKVMEGELGENWRSKFETFDDRPLAAASIGQVHSASLKDGRLVAIKVQYPGVAKGIDSDISNLLAMLNFAKILPDGLFVDKVIEHMKVELAQECDYLREAECCQKMREILAPYSNLYVPEIINSLSTKQVFTTELIEGLTIDQCAALDQETRNFITQSILELLFRELFIHRYMQTDPNWANFLYNPRTHQVGLLDFGATREYRPFFVNNYFKIIDGAANDDPNQVLEYSRKVGFLTGYEADIMNDAHTESVMILGECFRYDDLFDFETQNTTKKIQEKTTIMLKHRLCPPPPEVYSLHRKMSGLFLLAARLRAKINCYPIWQQIRSEFTPHPE